MGGPSGTDKKGPHIASMLMQIYCYLLSPVYFAPPRAGCFGYWSALGLIRRCGIGRDSFYGGCCADTSYTSIGCLGQQHRPCLQHGRSLSQALNSCELAIVVSLQELLALTRSNYHPTHNEDVLAVDGELQRRASSITSWYKGNLNLPAAVGPGLSTGSVVEVANTSGITTVIERQYQTMKTRSQTNKETKYVDKCWAESRVVVASSTPLGHAILVEELSNLSARMNKTCHRTNIVTFSLLR
jgi:hypothetical protein